jgi:hypothetical protein
VRFERKKLKNALAYYNAGVVNIKVVELVPGLPKKIHQTTTTITKWPQLLPNTCKVYRMAVKYTKIFYSKAFLKIPDFWYANKTL